jgi:hypothetical protein
MKLEPRKVHFLPIFPWPGRRRLRFARTRTSLQVQETGLVVQGQLRKLSMPLFDLFFTTVLSEHATVTIPYSRIRSLRRARLLGWRSVLTFLAWLPALLVLVLFMSLLSSGRSGWTVGEAAYVVSLAAALGVVLTLYLNCWLLVSRLYLLFEQADGEPALLSFRIRSRKVRDAFLGLVEANRRLAESRRPAGSGPALPLRPVAPFFPFLILVAATVLPSLTSVLWRAVVPAPLYRGEGGVASFGQMLAQINDTQRFLGTVLYFIHSLYGWAPVLLLAFLLWRWYEGVRLAAVILLALHGLLAVFWPCLLRPLWNPAVAVPVRFGTSTPEWLELSPVSLVALVFYLVLALALVLAGPRKRQG